VAIDDAGGAGTTRGSAHEAIREELERVRGHFHAVVATLHEADWRAASLNPAWTIAELLSHVTVQLGSLPCLVEVARSGRGLPPLPRLLVDRLNVGITRRGARDETLQTIHIHYDAAHAAALVALELVRDDEWQRGHSFFGEYYTIEALFRSHARHFAEHLAQLRPADGPGQSHALSA
jgi:hypothetical protein